MAADAPPRPSLSLPWRSVDPAYTLIAAALVVIAVVTWAGLRASRAATARKGELAQVQAQLAGFEDLNRRFAPAVAAESLSWRQTWLQLRERGVFGDDRLGMTRTIAAAAEGAGLGDVRVLIGSPDTTGLEARLSTGGIRRKSAPFSLLVEGRGSMRSVIAFIGQLPPSVAVTHLGLVRQDGNRRHRISLAVYELEFTNGSPVGTSLLWTPLEPRAPGGGDGRSPGN